MLNCPQENVQFFLKKISRMKKPNKSRKFYEFGVYRLDCEERVLLSESEIIPLPPRVFDTLCILVQNHGKILSKQAILDAVWGDSFVEEGNLTQNIYTLRRVLGTDENNKNFIETLSKKGYRFSADVRLVTENNQLVDSVEEPKVLITENSENKAVSELENKKSPRFKYLIPVVVSLALIFLLGFFSLYYFRTDKKEPQNNSLQKMEFRQLTFSGKAEYPVIAPAGDSFAYVSDGAIHIQDSDSEKALKLDIPDENNFSFLQFSPDSKTINYRNNPNLFIRADVFQVSRFGGEKKKIAENVWSGFSFSPNGNFLAFVRISVEKDSSALIIKNLISGEERELVVLDSPSRFVRFAIPAWSPNGSKIAISISKQIIHNAASQLAVFDVASGASEELSVPQLKEFEHVIWFPEGNSLAAVARENKKFFQIWEISYPEGKTRRITNDGNTYHNLSLSSDGKKIITGLFSISSNIWSVGKENAESRKEITSGNLSRDGVVGLSLTGKDEILYSSRIAGNIDLWKASLKNDSKQQLTKNAGDVNSQPMISPDGKYIYFNSNRSGNVQIWRMDAESGDNQTQITFGEKESALFPQISPDGNIIYYLKRGDKKNSIWRKFLDSGKEELLPIEGDITPLIELALSPDGKYLGTCNISAPSEEENANQPIQIAVISTTQTAQPMLFTAASCEVIWTQNSKAFDYYENLESGAKIWRQKVLADSKSEMILNLKDASINHFVWTGDEKTLVFSRGRQTMDAVQLADFR